MARIVAATINAIGIMLAKGKALRIPVSEADFMPDYLGLLNEEAPVAPMKSIEQQHAEFRAFTARYRKMKEDLEKPNGI